MSSPRIGNLSHRALSNMRDRTGRVAGRLSCGPLCIPVFPLGGKQPGPILCQTGWIGKSTGEMVVCCLAAANSRDSQRIPRIPGTQYLLAQTNGEPFSSNRRQPLPPHDREQPQRRGAGAFLAAFPAGDGVFRHVEIAREDGLQDVLRLVSLSIIRGPRPAPRPYASWASSLIPVASKLPLSGRYGLMIVSPSAFPTNSTLEPGPMPKSWHTSRGRVIRPLEKTMALGMASILLRPSF